MAGRARGVRAYRVAVLLAAVSALAGCAGSAPGAGSSTPARPPAAAHPTAEPSGSGAAPPTAAPTRPPSAGEEVPHLAPTPRRGPISLRVPAIGVHRLRVVGYRGSADDLAGTRIQDRGVAATPRGPRGGVRPGQVGNFVVTAHRTAAGRPFGQLPALRVGEHVLVETGGLVYDYRITRTMTISFRSPSGPARQSAPVPGRLGLTATRPMITLSTCATPEDHAAGNFWSDALHNPEHRIDKVGVLVATRPA